MAYGLALGECSSHARAWEVLNSADSETRGLNRAEGVGDPNRRLYGAVVEFEDALAEGLAVDVEAFWGAGFLQGRYRVAEVSWDWADEVRPWMDAATRALDMGTGEGGVLAGLVPLPRVTVAYEEWPPTIPAAKATLQPLGVHLVQALGGADNVGAASERKRPGLPFANGTFDVVLNRHEAFDPVDVRRVTRPGGTFLTQQVGGDEAASVRSLLSLPPDGPAWNASVAVDQLESAGWRIDNVREERPLSGFTDIGALLAYIRSLPWAYTDLDLPATLPRLRQLHDQAQLQPIPAVSHRFLIRATR